MRIPKKVLDERIPQAINLIKSELDPDHANIAIRFSSTDKGHISSFGANMVLSSPLMAAILLKSNQKKHLSEWLLHLLKIQNPAISQTDLIAYLSSATLNSKTRMDLAICAVALKMALRTFPELANK